MNALTHHVSSHRLEIAIYAIVLSGAVFSYLNTHFTLDGKLVVPVGLSIFVIASTLAVIQIRQIRVGSA